jgi:hypothetical protein
LSLSRFLQKPTQCRRSIFRDVRFGLRVFLTVWVGFFLKVYLSKYTPHLLKIHTFLLKKSHYTSHGNTLKNPCEKNLFCHGYLNTPAHAYLSS